MITTPHVTHPITDATPSTAEVTPSVVVIAVVAIVAIIVIVIVIVVIVAVVVIVVVVIVTRRKKGRVREDGGDEDTTCRSTVPVEEEIWYESPL